MRPQLGTPNFCCTKVLPEIFNRSNFKYSAFRGLKVWEEKEKIKKSKKKDAKQENSSQIGVNEITKRNMVDYVLKIHKPFFINIDNYRNISVQIRQLFAHFWPVTFFHETRLP